LCAASKFSAKTGAGISDLCPSAEGNSGEDAGGGLTLMTDFILSPYSVEFESSCNSTGIGELALNVAGVEFARSLVNSIPTSAVADSFDNISHVAPVISEVLFETVLSSSKRRCLVPQSLIWILTEGKRSVLDSSLRKMPVALQ
jgi:hypothetical protein